MPAGNVVRAAAVAVTLVGGLAASTLAQEASPSAAPRFADALGLPEFNVTVTDEAIEGLPSETAAGLYLLNLEVEAAEGGGVGFLQLPDGMDADGFLDVVAGPPPGDGTGGATPGADAMEAPPEWIYQTRFAGGTYGDSGQTAQAVIELTPGEWIAWGDDPTAPQPPVGITVTEAEEAAASAPEADATIATFEYGFTIEGDLGAGPRTIAVENVGAQPHFVFMAKTPDGVTMEQVGQILELEMQGATPAPDSGLPNPDEFLDVVGTASQSTGTTLWVPADLEPGQYLVICFFPDIESGMPHAMEGMYDLITVEG